MKQFWDAKEKKNEVRKNDYSTRVWKYLDCTLKIHVHFTIHEILHFARIWYVVGRLAIRDFHFFFILWFMCLFKCSMCIKKELKWYIDIDEHLHDSFHTMINVFNTF